ncbi:MAG TPA: hypothetical protein V6C63_01480, partial [Allocoleopsis sp.]
PHPAAAQTTLPTITVIGKPPQSAAEIQQLLDQVRQPLLIEEALESIGVMDGPEYPQTSLSLPTTDCRLSQDARTNAVASFLSSPNAPSTYLLFGTEVTVNYANANSSETFVVTGGGSGAPNSDPVRAITPVAGSLVCNP